MKICNKPGLEALKRLVILLHLTDSSDRKSFMIYWGVPQSELITLAH